MKEKMRRVIYACFVVCVGLLWSCKKEETPLSCASQGVVCGANVSLSTVGLSNKLWGYDGVSWDESGPEVVYSKTVAPGESVLLKVTEVSADFEADYFILRSCESANEVLAWGDKSASVCLQPGTYYVVVDGRDGAQGNAEVHFSCGPCSSEGSDDLTSGDATDGNGPPDPVCGDGNKDFLEECENDGHCADGQRCNDQCQCVENKCGNGVKDEGELCETDEDCLLGQCIACNCTDSCGDGVVDSDFGEQCELDKQCSEGQRCSNHCQCVENKCGDGVKDDNEWCETDEDCVLGECIACNCTDSCGDGIVDSDFGEECELDKQCSAGQRCSNHCQCVENRCGDGVKDDDEWCEADDDCLLGQCIACNCTDSCGDGTLDSDFGEQCENDSHCDYPATCNSHCQCEKQGGGQCGCTCDPRSMVCSPNPAGTTFTSEGCQGWDDSQECSGFVSVYCPSQCPEGDNACYEQCHAALQADDGSTFTYYDCSITIHCP